MKFLFDIFPVLIFFAVFKMYGIMTATAAAIVATVAQVIWSWVRHRKVEKMLLISAAIIVVFGGATLLLDDEIFIKWKPSVLYWAFSGILLISEVFFRKNLIKAMMGAQITLPDILWKKLNQAWAAFFAVMGVLNLYIAMNYSTDIWVNFKLFGGTGLLIAFAIGQALMLARHIDADQKNGN